MDCNTVQLHELQSVSTRFKFQSMMRGGFSALTLKYATSLSKEYDHIAAKHYQYHNVSMWVSKHFLMVGHHSKLEKKEVIVG